MGPSITATVTEVEPSLAAINGASPTSAYNSSAAAPGAAIIAGLTLIGATVVDMGQSAGVQRLAVGVLRGRSQNVVLAVSVPTGAHNAAPPNGETPASASDLPSE
jgi:hypothetical protein